MGTTSSTITGLVSIIIPTYNVGPYITKSIVSALQQSYELMEIIVVDDHSSDDTLNHVVSLADPRIRIITLSKTVGPGNARNVGIRYARGEWIALLDGDDWMDVNRIQYLITMALENNADIVADNVWLISHDNLLPWSTWMDDAKIKWPKIKQLVLEDLIKKDMSFIKPVIKTSFLKSNRLKYPDLPSEDMFFLLECLRCEPNMLVTKTPYYFYRSRLDSIVSNQVRSLRGTLEALMNYQNGTEPNSLVNQVLQNRIKDTQHAIQVRDLINKWKRRDFTSVNETLFNSPSSAIWTLAYLPQAVARRWKKRQVQVTPHHHANALPTGKQ
ncbi:MAG: hypothetical protein C7B46_10070 [Sulfobacillus benefaciens]|uniref:Glycosyltransferase 2-like domain-containing protein n=1 Tax=Sulfobacillus benefaciens TaxID=453960 RepID=A0A2T2XFW3_9FIRM|nr:MAG: hypothetical protein C7B46_10070 [Sulfobacillus benefaciens]